MPYFEEQIAAHALQEAPREACGLVFRDPERDTYRAEPAPNVAKDPERFFEVPPETFLEALKSGLLLGYYHSHPTGSADPTPADKAVAEETSLPAWIYSVEERVLNCYVPSGYRAPLEGRRFVPLVHDCVSLAWDYMRDVRGIEMPFLPRTQRDYGGGVKFDWRKWLPDLGGQILPATNPERHDVLVMTTTGAKGPNHIGIFLGDGIFLHHPGNGVSQRSVWDGYWQKCTSFIVRLAGPPPAPAAPPAYIAPEEDLQPDPAE